MGVFSCKICVFTVAEELAHLSCAWDHFCSNFDNLFPRISSNQPRIGYARGFVFVFAVSLICVVDYQSADVNY